MTSQSPSQTRRSNTGRSRNSSNMANTKTPDQSLRDLKINDNAPTTSNSGKPSTILVGDDASDNVSVASSSRPRRHRRGGRKKNNQTIPVDEARLPWSERLDEGMSGLEDSEVGKTNSQRENTETPKGGEVSDNASVASSSRPRRHKRGGRRKKSRMAAVDEAEAQLPWSERLGRLGENLGGPAQEKSGSVRGEQSPSRETREKTRPMSVEQNLPQENEKSRDTGIRAFNIKRMQGKRPFGISIDRGEGAEGSEEKAADGKEEREGEKEEKAKPVSIRLDINLEVEMFLKAAIKGDVTITFLE